MKRIQGLVLFTLLVNFLVAQENQPPFYHDIQVFKKQDSAGFPPKNAILFIGSSSFTLWKDVEQYFPGHTIINRGFGGSTLQDQLLYINDIVLPYHPKQVVVYCGENDLASSDTVTAQMVFTRFRLLFNRIRAELPGVHIVYVSMKPSPSRQLLLVRMRDGNALIRGFLKKRKHTGYVDVYGEMIDDEGRPVADLFLDDQLHMNKKGYAIWQKLIEPHLLK